MRGLDHIVHAVRDLDAAAAFYRALGFQAGARNRHPPTWGTQNHIVQLPGTFIELLGMADASGTVPHAPRFFSFGAFNRDFLARGQGLSMLVLSGRGAPDVAEFQQSGIGDFDLYEFGRGGKRPDGTPIKVAFALAYAVDQRAPDVGFFTCLHRHPENFWNPAFQTHPNTAAAVAGVVLVAEHPSAHRDFLSGFAGSREWSDSPQGLELRTLRGNIDVIEPAAFADRYGVSPPEVARGARLAALRFALRDVRGADAIWRAAGLNARKVGERMVFGPDFAFGATLVFEAAMPV